jgi:hypothetical protein
MRASWNELPADTQPLRSGSARTRSVARGLRWRPVDEAHNALLADIRRRLQVMRDDLNVTNTDGSNYWGPRITKAVKDREDDGPDGLFV